MKYWKRFKAWARRTWKKFTGWLTGILVSLGLITVALVQSMDVTYTPATEYVDGTPLPIEDIAETRLYCNDVVVASEPGADGVFQDVVASLPVGDNVCYGTHIGTNALESDASNSITVTVRPNVAPKPPELNP